MTQITGKIYDIHEFGSKQAQIVIRKKIGDKIVPVAITVFGYYYDKIKSQGLRQGDRIKGKLYIKSKFWDKGNRYISDIFFKEVNILERSNQMQFSKRVIKVDKQTGEILD